MLGSSIRRPFATATQPLAIHVNLQPALCNLQPALCNLRYADYTSRSRSYFEGKRQIEAAINGTCQGHKVEKRGWIAIRLFACEIREGGVRINRDGVGN